MKRKITDFAITALLSFAAVLFLFPVVSVAINSFKGQLFITDSPFSFPTAETFAGVENYVGGIEKTRFIAALGYSLFITLASSAAILLFTSMTAYYITRVKNTFTKAIYYLLVFSMIVPFQMVMFTTSKIVNLTGLDTPWGIVVVYLGFGAGLSVFLFSSAVKSVPYQLDEAAAIDGASPIRTFFGIIFPLLTPTAVTVAILNVMWIYNDYLLPYLTIGHEYKTVPVAVQYLQGGYGSRDMGALMAMLVLAMLPVAVFYVFSQKYIIRGLVSGAVKG